MEIKITFDITSAVVEQGIILASILAGFGLTVSAQVAFASKQTSLDQTTPRHELLDT